MTLLHHVVEGVGWFFIGCLALLAIGSWIASRGKGFRMIRTHMAGPAARR